MSFYNEFEYEDRIYKYCYADFDPKLKGNIVDMIMLNIVDMNHCEENERDIVEENFEARFKYVGYKNLGTIHGECFNVDVESEKGKSRLSIIIMERIPKNKLN